MADKTNAPWLRKSYQAVVEHRQELDRKLQPDRVWLNEGETGEFTFIDDEPQQADDHTAKDATNQIVHFTCAAVLGDDTCCTRVGKAQYTGFYTVMDCRRYVSDTGTVYQYGLKLFPAPVIPMETLRRKREQRTSFTFTRCKITRSGERSPRCGNDFEFGAAVKDMNKFFQLAHFKGTSLEDIFTEAETPTGWAKWSRVFDLTALRADTGRLIRKVPTFNYVELLEPRTGDALKRFLAGMRKPWDDRSRGKGKGGAEPPPENADF